MRVISARHFRTGRSYLSDAEFFLDQRRPAGYLQAPMNTARASAWSFSSNEDFWHAVLHERLRASRAVSLSGFYLSEWIPRSPGLFHTPAAAQSRDIAMSMVVSEPYAEELAGIDHADLPQFEREVYGTKGTARSTCGSSMREASSRCCGAGWVASAFAGTASRASLFGDVGLVDSDGA